MRNVYYYYSMQVLTCWASIPFTYMFSFLFSNSLAAFAILMIIFFFSSLVSVIPSMSDSNLPPSLPPSVHVHVMFSFALQFGQTIILVVQLAVSNKTVVDVLHYIFLLIPSYG